MVKDMSQSGFSRNLITVPGVGTIHISEVCNSGLVVRQHFNAAVFKLWAQGFQAKKDCFDLQIVYVIWLLGRPSAISSSGRIINDTSSSL